MKLTLLQRPAHTSVDDFETQLQKEFSMLESGLSAQAKIAGFSKGGWVQVDVTGEDHEILEELISRQFNLAITNLSQIELFGSYSGLVASRYKNLLEVDVGVEIPALVRVQIGVGAMRSQLCDGKQLSMEELTDTYSLHPETRIVVRISSIKTASRLVEGWLADAQIKSLSEEIVAGLQCVRIYHCTRMQVEYAVKRANLERDIVTIDSPTITTQSVVCKLGTDAVGLIPRLGSVLRKSQLEPFIPTRVISRCREW